jgi:putative redox protein
MVEVQVAYQGELRCEAKHGPSGTTILTDPPVDNMGKGESFSPTDLVATALGACMLTLMGISASRHNLDISGTRATVTKEMVSDPFRRIGRLGVTISVPHQLSEDDRKRLERAAMTCPVHKSLHPDVQQVVEFKWG